MRAARSSRDLAQALDFAGARLSPVGRVLAVGLLATSVSHGRRIGWKAEGPEEGEVYPGNVEILFEENHASRDLDFIVIDIDSNDRGAP